MIHHIIDHLLNFDFLGLFAFANAGCIIIAKPAGVKLDEIVYRNCFNRNDHGAGMCFVDDGKLVIIKGLNTIEEALEKIFLHEDKEMLIHFRIMSKGAISDENCHPFHVPGDSFPEYEFAVMHNGTLPWRSTLAQSDTSCFVEDALGPYLDRDPYFLDQPFGRMMLAQFVGSSNKLAIMRCNSEKKEVISYIINKKEGIEFGGCWFSNLSFSDDNSRYIIASDHERMKKWTPKLWVETPPVKSLPYYGYGQGDWENGRDGHHHSSSGRGKQPELIKLPERCGFWEFHGPLGVGYGWHNVSVDYKGQRGISDFNAFKALNHNKGKKSNIPEVVAMDTLDMMPYLTAEEERLARKECLAICSEEYPEFSPKKWSTMELAAAARALARQACPDYEGLSNRELMKILISGDEISAS